jgi:hypothetical protein
VSTERSLSLLLDDAVTTADWIADRQHDNGFIAWFDGGHGDPWNHVEAAMALDVTGRPDAALAAYRWLAKSQGPDGSWHNYYSVDEHGDVVVSDAKVDTNTVAYLATGLWHHHLCVPRSTLPEEMFVVVDRAIDYVLRWQRRHGEIAWAVHADGTAWSYALLTGSSSVLLSLRCAIRLADLLGHRRTHWIAAANRLHRAIAARPELFEPKDRWSMDWYYPVLCGAIEGLEATERLAEGWDRFVIETLGVRCVSDQPWVTAAETAECAMAHVVAGDVQRAEKLLATTSRHRHSDGSYLTGLAYHDAENPTSFPHDERTTYSAAAVLLARDALAPGSPTNRLFRPPRAWPPRAWPPRAWPPRAWPPRA